MMKVLPQSLYENDAVVKVLRDGLSCVLYKEFRDTIQKEGYVSTHALTLVLKGTLRIENDRGGIATLVADQMIFVPKGLYMVSDVVPKDAFEPFIAIVFFFDEALIESFTSSVRHKHAEPQCFSNLILNYSENIRLYTETLLKLYKNNDHSHHAVTKPKLFELLHLLAIGEQGEQFISSLIALKNKTKRNIKDFMLANFYKPLSVEDYAYLTGRSLSTFNRDFKRQFNVSPKQWLMNKRMERAYELLSSANNSVTEIALEAGYENFSHFIKAFHSRYGISPKQFVIRKRNEALV